jgi:hypothetical protein
MHQQNFSSLSSTSVTPVTHHCEQQSKPIEKDQNAPWASASRATDAATDGQCASPQEIAVSTMLIPFALIHLFFSFYLSLKSWTTKGSTTATLQA